VGLVELARFYTPLQADLARLFVESYGINAVVFDGNSFGNSDGAIISVRLMVSEEQLEDAREALRDYRP
jgi:hypothetical protein